MAVKRHPLSPEADRLARRRRAISTCDMATSTATQSPKRANALLIMAKRPIPGRTKTRMVPPLSPEQAAALYACFLQDTLELARQVPNVQPVIAYTPANAEAYFTQLAPDLECFPQKGPDLGARLDNAMTHYLSRGFPCVAAINSDSPNLPLAYLTQAFEQLMEEADVVLGPTDDGGYYLIGLKHPAPRLLREVRMSTPRVTLDTLALAVEEELRVVLLPNWYDVDGAESLMRLKAALATAPPDIARHTQAFLGS